MKLGRGGRFFLRPTLAFACGAVLVGQGAANQPPVALSVTPSSGSGSSQTFAVTGSDPNGAGDIFALYFLVNVPPLNGANACFVEYRPALDQLRLMVDAGNGWLGPITPGSGMLSNTQCSLNGAGSSASSWGNHVTMNVALSFNPSFAGGKTLYLDVDDNAGASSGYQVLGTWTVTGPQQPDFVLSTPQPNPMDQGTSATTVETVTAINGFASPVNFSYSGWPPGLSASFIPPQLIPTGTASIVVAAAPGASAATYSLPFTATGSGIAHTAAVSVTVLQQTCRLIVEQPSGTPTATRAGGNLVWGSASLRLTQPAIANWLVYLRAHLKFRPQGSTTWSEVNYNETATSITTATSAGFSYSSGLVQASLEPRGNGDYQIDLTSHGVCDGQDVNLTPPNPLPSVLVLRKACDDADAIAVGTLESVSIGFTQALFTLAVDTVVKGEIQASSVLAPVWPGSVTAARMRPARYRALWFLRLSGSGVWQIVPIGGPKAPIYASGLAVPPGAHFDLAGTSSGTCYGRVWSVLRKTADHIDESAVYFTAMETLLRDRPADMAALVPDFADAMRDFGKSASVNLRGLALASGIRAHDVVSLSSVAAQARTIANSPASAQVSLALYAWRSPEPSAIASLGSIAQSAGIDHLSAAAANSLMMIHTKETVPYLVKLLAAGDASLQDVAVRGLSFFVRGAPIFSAANGRSMAYLTDKPAGEFLDARILPYVTITPVPPARLPEYVHAWVSWWNRVERKWGP